MGNKSRSHKVTDTQKEIKEMKKDHTLEFKPSKVKDNHLSKKIHEVMESKVSVGDKIHQLRIKLQNLKTRMKDHQSENDRENKTLLLDRIKTLQTILVEKSGLPSCPLSKRIREVMENEALSNEGKIDQLESKLKNLRM